MMFMKVDLPDPEGPITATNSPCSMASETDCRAGGVPGAAVSYCFPRFSTSMKRPAMAARTCAAASAIAGRPVRRDRA